MLRTRHLRRGGDHGADRRRALLVVAAPEQVERERRRRLQRDQPQALGSELVLADPAGGAFSVSQLAG